MAFRYGNREQISFLPNSIDEYISPADPARAYDAFVDALNLQKLAIDEDTLQVGNPEYDPKAMLKLLVYGYSYGIRSSRKLERAVHHNLSFIWLVGGLKPDHKTISNFRKRYRKALQQVLKQCARMCLKLDLIEGNTLFVDGSKIRANASLKNTWTVEKCNRALENVDKRIELILSECDAIDEQEAQQASLVKMGGDLKVQENLKEKIRDILQELKEEGKASVNTVDADCTKTKSIHGSHAGYNGQIVVDKKKGLIVHSDVVNKNNDREQFSSQIFGAIEDLGKKCECAVADAGFASTEELKKVDAENIRVIVPSEEQIMCKGEGPYRKENFQYDAERDCYICPEGNVLTLHEVEKARKRKIYRTMLASICKTCKAFGKCTQSPSGRKIYRLLDQEIKEKLEKQFEEPESQAVFALRKEKVELPFGHIKRNLKLDAFLLRGLEGVKAEMALLATCFNLSRMINIFGVLKLCHVLS